MRYPGRASRIWCATAGPLEKRAKDHPIEVPVDRARPVFADRPRRGTLRQLHLQPASGSAAQDHPTERRRVFHRIKPCDKRTHAVPKEHRPFTERHLAVHNLVELVLILDKGAPAVLFPEPAKLVLVGRAPMPDVVNPAGDIAMLRQKPHKIMVTAHMLRHPMADLHDTPHLPCRDVKPSEDGVQPIGTFILNLFDSNIQSSSSFARFTGQRGRRPRPGPSWPAAGGKSGRLPRAAPRAGSPYKNGRSAAASTSAQGSSVRSAAYRSPR